jgi:hypothetical protein
MMFQNLPNANDCTMSNVIKAYIGIPRIELSQGKVRNPVGNVFRVAVPNNSSQVDNSNKA